MKISDYKKQDGIGLAELIKKKEVSAEEVLQTALELAETLNPSLNAITQLFNQKAQKLLKKAPIKAPLYGVPCLLKDINFPLSGTLDTYGSRLFQANYSSYNSDYVNALLQSGLVPFGKTNVAEFGLSFDTDPQLFGNCINPLNPELMTGGSSGGSAAAVASGIVPIATANDGGGSIRVPATCCGLFGFKPSVGLTPDGPDFAEVWSGFATSHVLTRSIRDSALMLDLIKTPKAKGQYYHASQQYPSSLRMAIITDLSVPVEQAYLKAVNELTHQLSHVGHMSEEVILPIDFEVLGEAVITLVAANTFAMLSTYDDKAIEQAIEPISYQFYLLGKQLNAADVINAKNQVYKSTQPLRILFDEYDVLVTPALAKPPLPAAQLAKAETFEDYLTHNFEFSPFTGLFNQTGMPAMTIPTAKKLNEIPISVQFAANWGQDELLFKLANQIQHL